MTIDYRGLAGAAALALAAGAAGADSTPYYIGGYVGYTHFSNALGLPDGADVPLGQGYVSKADDVTTVALVAGLDQTIGRQRVFGDLTLRDNRYSDNKLLDSKTYSASAGVDWETIERISGNFMLRSNRDRIRFGVFDRPSGERNLVTSNQADFAARIGVVTSWTFEAGAGWRGVDYTAPSYAPREVRQVHYSAGTRYRPSRATFFGLKLRETDGRYPHHTPTGRDSFDRRDVELSAFHEFSGLSSVNVRAAYTRIDYGRQDLDFSGFTGSLRANYEPTGKLRFIAQIARDRAQDLRFSFVEFSSDGIVFETFESAELATAMRLRASYAMTSKVALTAGAGHSRRTVSLLTADVQGRERTNNLSLGATWTPTRTSLVSCEWNKNRRKSDLLAERFNVSSSSLGCYGQLTIQP